MSLLMLKTKNLSWQDHTLNIEAMLAPLRSTLLMNKHKTLDAKFDQEKALFQRQRDACLKDFVVEKRLIERRRQKIINRKKEIMQEVRAQSALEHANETKSKVTPADNKERSLSAPSDGRLRRNSNTDGVSNITSALPKLTLKHSSLLGGNFLRPRMFLETGLTANAPPSESDTNSNTDFNTGRLSTTTPNVFITTVDQIGLSSAVSTQRHNKSSKVGITEGKGHQSMTSKLPKPPPNPPMPKLPKGSPNTGRSQTHGNKRIPSVSFLGLLNNDLDDDDEDYNGRMNHVVVEVKQKTVEDKVREFLKELDAFNSRPPTSCSDGDETFSVLSSIRSRDFQTRPLVANRYHTLTMDKKLLEKAFDKYMEKRSHEDLLKAMKLAAKMKAHIRQARNTSIIPTMATMKSSKTFLKLLKRQHRIEKHGQQMS